MTHGSHKPSGDNSSILPDPPARPRHQGAEKNQSCRACLIPDQRSHVPHKGLLPLSQGNPLTRQRASYNGHHSDVHTRHRYQKCWYDLVTAGLQLVEATFQKAQEVHRRRCAIQEAVPPAVSQRHGETWGEGHSGAQIWRYSGRSSSQHARVLQDVFSLRLSDLGSRSVSPEKRQHGLGARVP